MNIFIEKHQELLKELIIEKVDFILIGGYAVIYYGYMRTTGDMDLWLQPTNENKLKILNVLKKFEFNSEGINHIKNLDFTKHIAFHFWEMPERVDFLTKISGVTYEDADKLKEIADFEGLKIPVIHYNHLISCKIATNRPKDLADIDRLQKINRLKDS